jgi:thiol-disulfide isomerase/thioredoxin
MKYLFIAICLSLSASAFADVIHLTNGKDINGTVAEYGNMNFTIEQEGGASLRQAAAMVKSIEFSPRAVSFELRGRPKIEGNITSYEGGAFLVQTADGKTEKIPAMFASSLSFGGLARKFMLLSGGTKLDLKKVIAPGKITIVDFYAEWCGTCKQLGPQLEKLNKEDSDVVLRKVDIIDWNSQVAKQFELKGIPNVQIYDRNGKLAGTVTGASIDAVRTHVKAAKQAK